jgi:23S rRNA (uridine2552-2'-O)-methyltransferase
MAKKGSSKRWMAEHKSDEYVAKAKADGYRSRAVYKLLEVIEKDKIIKTGDSVLDLGAAPGSWSEVAAQRVGKNGKVVASDILDIEPIAGVDFLCGDFTSDEVYENLLKLVPEKIDCVICDMAPNMSGQLSVDIPRAMYLCELALDMTIKTLKKDGYFLIKVFQGDGFDKFVKDCKNSFQKVIIRKPKASRPRSKEVYLLAQNLK